MMHRAFSRAFCVTFLRNVVIIVVAFLEKNGIETRSMFSGNILRHPGYEHLEVKSYINEADWILEHSFWIGVHPRYSKKDIDWVVSIFKKYYGLSKGK